MKNILKSILFILPYLVIGQELSRRGNWQASFKEPTDGFGAKVVSIEPNSPMEKANIKVGDIVLKVDGVHVSSSEQWSTIFYSLREDKEIKLMLRRLDEVFNVKLSFNAIPLEENENVETIYGQIISDAGVKQRTIITRPKNVKGKLPSLVLVQGLSCSTVEVFPGRNGNWSKQIKYLVENSNMVVMRVEKPGVGDSDGDCSETDFLTELEGYRAAIRTLKGKDYVDSKRIVVYGSSLGSALAPLLANEFDLAGVISEGTFFKTWFEHMLEIERRIRKMSGDDESTITKKMNQGYIPLYYAMLVEKKTYQEIINENPSLVEYNYHSKRHMYGKPVEYYHQLQKFDLASEWEKLKVPVRILYGSNDWIMSEQDQDMIIDVLDKAEHQDHKLVVYPGLDHWNTIHKTPEDSFNGGTGEWDDRVPKLIIEWCKEILH
ncbi:alpha/beta fold hydrolase [uncultured Croceitalea sp.]|uniref:alpha/beta fold hydrolase n=1 Tax=uncultured Croceitalea sp. TaxID=1798908 RepID=UPI0033063163